MARRGRHLPMALQYVEHSSRYVGVARIITASACYSRLARVPWQAPYRILACGGTYEGELATGFLLS